MDAAVFGDHPGIVQLCKDAVAASQIDDIPFSFTVICKNADKLEKEFLAECPGIAHPTQGVAVHKPAFIKISPGSEEFQELLFVRPKECSDPEREKAAAFIQSASYLIVYAADADRNLTLAMYLREWYIKTDPFFTRLPFIAMYCENRDRAEHDYYVRSFNRDASMINALVLPYRLFSAGIMFPDWQRFAAGVSQRQLADEFEEWMKEGDDLQRRSRLEILAIQEHGRWNRAMLSRGRMGASAEQLQAYIQRGCSSHQLHIAKLHPFICSWERLGDTDPVETGMQKEYSFIVKQIHPGKEPSDIHEIDRENVRKTPIFLREL